MRTRSVIAGGAIAALLGALAILAGCAKQAAEAPAPPLVAALPGGLQVEASILDLMLEFINPNANELWESVAEVSTRTGTELQQPHTDADWNTLRRKALTLVETANLLVVDGRQVARPGQNLAEAGGEGDFTPAQAQSEIDKDRASFVAFARLLQIASGEMLKAIDKRDAQALFKAGGALDEACEACHRKFWYPNSPVPPGA